jgi:hypothetical protein
MANNAVLPRDRLEASYLYLVIRAGSACRGDDVKGFKVKPGDQVVLNWEAARSHPIGR